MLSSVSNLHVKIVYLFSHYTTWGVSPMDPLWKSNRNNLWLRQIYHDIDQSSRRFKPSHVKSVYSKSKSCQRNWIIWAGEPSECFTPAQVTERPATSQGRVLCEAVEQKCQLNMKSHPHILLKPPENTFHNLQTDWPSIRLKSGSVFQLWTQKAFTSIQRTTLFF